jgi:hypothetical protein
LPDAYLVHSYLIANVAQISKGCLNGQCYSPRKSKCPLKPIRFNMYILPLSWVTLSHQEIQTAVETDKFTKVYQRMAMFDSVCNWDGFYSESCLRFALEKHC